MNEFFVIEEIKKLLKKPGKDVLVGIGDDAAVIVKNKNNYQLVTCDSIVENVHFLKDKITPFDLGQKAVAVNASDIAAMGGIPKHILVSLIVPKDTPQSFINKLYKGISFACKKYNIDVIGGNMSQGTTVIIDITMLGEVKKTNVILRNGAKLGDVILVTGLLGNDPKIPEARIREAQILGKSGKVTAMIDLSDGLASDIAHICIQSNFGAKIYASNLPRFQGVPLQRALTWGQDYELCFTTKPQHANYLKKLVEQETKTPVTIIGEIIPSKILLVMPNGKEVTMPKGGWDHFL